MRLKSAPLHCYIGRKTSDMPDSGHSEVDYGEGERLHEHVCVQGGRIMWPVHSTSVFVLHISPCCLAETSSAFPDQPIKPPQA